MPTKCSTCIKPYNFESCCFCHGNQEQNELTEKYLRIIKLRQTEIIQGENGNIDDYEVRSHMAV